jgi:hypothetical protein
MPTQPRKGDPVKLDSTTDSKQDPRELTDDERAALDSETAAVGDDGYRRDNDGNVVNPDDNEFAIYTDTEGNVTRDPNKD